MVGSSPSVRPVQTPCMLPLSLLVAAHLVTAATARRFLHSLPEDTYAFPKYRVVFLNGQPVLNETAQRWLTHGLGGGEQQFLGHLESGGPPISPKEIESRSPLEPPAANYSLEQMKMGPANSYLCLIPISVPNTPAPPDEDEADEPTPSRSWSLLQPLSGTCLYVCFSFCSERHPIEAYRTIKASPGMVYIFLLSQRGNSPVQGSIPGAPQYRR
jgi:hypothetical protein